MSPYPNLVSESILINDTISLLRSFNGRASAISVVDFVMKIRRPDREMARLLVAELVAADPRLTLIDDEVVLSEYQTADAELADIEFVVFDLETTGAKAPPCKITEIGAYRVRGGQVLEKFHTLVNPETPIPYFITGLTGIDDEMVADAPLFGDIIHDLLGFIGDSVLVAHNSGFDMRFLNHEIGMVFPEHRLVNPCLCTVQLSRRLLPDILNHKLSTVAKHYDIDLTNHHRAAADAFATAHIFVNLLTRARHEGVNDMVGLSKLQARKYKYKYAKRHAA